MTKSICKKCHFYRLAWTRWGEGDFVPLHRCSKFPTPIKTDNVTGENTFSYGECSKHNSDGDCSSWEARSIKDMPRAVFRNIASVFLWECPGV